MKIQDFNSHLSAVVDTARQMPPEPAAPILESVPPAVASPGLGATVDTSAEIDLLKAQVRHLEAVVETARALLNSNQERLLRSLYEAPREQVALSLRLKNGARH